MQTEDKDVVYVLDVPIKNDESAVFYFKDKELVLEAGEAIRDIKIATGQITINAIKIVRNRDELEVAITEVIEAQRDVHRGNDTLN